MARLLQAYASSVAFLTDSAATALAFTSIALQNDLQRKAQNLTLGFLATGGITADKIISQRVEEHALPLSTSLKSLDDLLEGGFRLGQLIEISGTIMKTLLALSVSLRLLLADEKARVLYVDVEATFNPQRAFAVLRHLADLEAVTSSQRDAELIKVLDRLIVTRCSGVKEIIKAMDEFAAGQPENHRRIVVIDSITPIYKQRMMASSTQGVS